MKLILFILFCIGFSIAHYGLSANNAKVAVNEYKEWNQFKVSHDCKIVFQYIDNKTNTWICNV